LSEDMQQSMAEIIKSAKFYVNKDSVKVFA